MTSRRSFVKGAAGLVLAAGLGEVEPVRRFWPGWTPPGDGARATELLMSSATARLLIERDALPEEPFLFDHTIPYGEVLRVDADVFEAFERAKKDRILRGL